MRRWLMLVALLLCAQEARGAWAQPNGCSATGSSVATIACTFTIPLTNPSILVVGAQFSSGQTITSVTDTAGNTFADCGPGSFSFGTTGNGQSFCANNAHTTASDVVTVHYSASTSNPRILAGEWTGGATSSPVDVTNKVSAQTSGPAGANNYTGAAVTTSGAGELIVALFGDQSTGAPTAGTSPNSFTKVATSVGGYVFEWFSQTSAGSITPTAGGSNTSESFGSLTVALKPASGGGSTAAPPTQMMMGCCAASESHLERNQQGNCR